MMNQNIAVKQTKRKRRSSSLDAKKARSGWLFVLPFVIGLLIIYLPVVYESIKGTFFELKMLPSGTGYEQNFVGFDNYIQAFTSESNKDFLQTLLTGIKDLAFDIPAIVIFSLFVAILLNEKMVGRAAFRAIFFVPVILCTGLIDAIDSKNTLLSYMNDTSAAIDMGSGEDTVNNIVSAGDLSWLFSSMKVGGNLVDYVTQIINEIYSIINRSGVQMLIFLAGLQSISPAIYESCSIDGATGWETFWKITIPMISPYILVNTVYTVIDSFTSSSNKVMTYIDGVYEQSGGRVISSAMSWMYFLIVMAIIALVVLILSFFVFYQRREH